MMLDRYTPEDEASCRILLESIPKWFAPEDVYYSMEHLAAGKTIVYRDDAGLVVGTLMWGIAANQPDERLVYLQSIAVHRDWHRRGVGGRMLAELERTLGPGHRIFLETLAEEQGNESYRATRNFYEAHGFERDSTYKSLDWGPGYIVDRYEKVL